MARTVPRQNALFVVIGPVLLVVWLLDYGTDILIVV